MIGTPLRVEVVAKNLLEFCFLFLVILLNLLNIDLTAHHRGTSAGMSHTWTTTMKSTWAHSLRGKTTGRGTLGTFAIVFGTWTTGEFEIVSTVLDVVFEKFSKLLDLLLGKRKYLGHLVHLNLGFLLHGQTFFGLELFCWLCYCAKCNQQSCG